jgi:hypothetical protein
MGRTIVDRSLGCCRGATVPSTVAVVDFWVPGGHVEGRAMIGELP